MGDAIWDDALSIWNTVTSLSEADLATYALTGLALLIALRWVLRSRRVDTPLTNDSIASGSDYSLADTAGKSHSIIRILLRNTGWLLVLTIVINVMMFAAPLHMLLVYDRVLSSGSVETLVMLTVICVVMILAMSLLTAARQWLLIGKAEELDRKLAPALFSHSVDAAVGNSSSRATSPLADLSTARQLLVSPTTVALLDLPFAPLFFLGLFVLHPYFGYMALAGAALMIAVVALGDFFTSGTAKRASSASAQAHQITHGVDRAAASIYTMGLTPRLLAIWRSMEFASTSAQSTASAQSALNSNIVKFVRLTLQSLTLALGAWLVLRQQASSGSMIASSIIMGRALAPLEVLIGGWKGFASSLRASLRLGRMNGQVFSDFEAATRRTRLPVPLGHLQVRHVTYRTNTTETPVLSDVSLAVEPGEMLAVVGEGGSGKSTLARLLVGLERPSEGKVTLDGADLANWPRAEIGPHIGYVAQELELLDGTIGDNISRFELNVAGAARDSVNRAIIEAAALSGAHETLAGLPRAYDTPISNSGKTLSASQRKRIALARAVYGDVRLVILDDPTAGLDAAGERSLATMLQRLREKRCTVVLVTQNVNLVQLADKVAILQNGSIAQLGTPQEVFNIQSLRPQPASRPQAAASAAPRMAQMTTVATGTGPAVTVIASPRHHGGAHAASMPPQSNTPTSVPHAQAHRSPAAVAPQASMSRPAAPQFTPPGSTASVEAPTRMPPPTSQVQSLPAGARGADVVRLMRGTRAPRIVPKQ